MIILLQRLSRIPCAPNAVFLGFSDYNKTSLSRRRFEGLPVSRSKSTAQTGSKCVRDQPLSLPRQTPPLHPADLYKDDSSLEFHAITEFLTSIALHPVKRHIFLRAWRIMPRHIARLKVFSQSQRQISQATPVIPDYQFQVKNNFSKAPLPWSRIPVPAKTALLIIPDNSSSIRASRTVGPRQHWSRGRLCCSCDANSTSTAL